LLAGGCSMRSRDRLRLRVVAVRLPRRGAPSDPTRC
jgi:hypothetical protein